MTSKTVSACFVFGAHKGLKLNILKPKLVMKGVKDVSVGLNHITFLEESGKVFTLGNDSYFKHLTHAHSLVPVLVDTQKMVKVQSGESFTVCLDEKGIVYTWGSNGKHSIWSRIGGSRHCLGIKRPSETVEPRIVELQEEIIDIKCGRKHCLALGNNNLYSWGYNDFGQLGNTELFGYNETPKHISFFSNLNEKVVKIEAAENSSAALTASGKVYVWGSNEHLNLGIGKKHIYNPEPLIAPVSLLKPIKEFTMGFNTMMLQDENDDLYASGMKMWSESRDFNVPFSTLQAQIVCGTDYFAVLAADGSIAHYGGPFNPTATQLEIPDQIEIMMKSLIPGTITKLNGKNEFIAAISQLPEEDPELNTK